MGTRVEFWEIPKADIKQAVISDLNEIRNWYRSIEEEFPEDVDYDLLVALEEIRTPEKLFEEFDINKINELVAFYIGDFCEYGPGKKRYQYQILQCGKFVTTLMTKMRLMKSATQTLRSFGISF